MHRLVAPILILATVACGRAPTGTVPGELSAVWAGRDQGSGRLEASAILCPRDSTLQIIAHQDDRGIGVALHLAAAVPTPGEFQLVHPETPFITRPAGTGAYRFLTVEALHPYVSRDGQVELTEVGPGWVSGTVAMTLVAQSGADTVAIRGSFDRVPVDSTRTPCGLAPPRPVEIF